MAWQDHKDPNTTLRLKLRPWAHTGLVLKWSYVLVGVVFTISLAATILSFVAKAPASDTLGWAGATLLFGLVFGAYAFIARLVRVWTKL